jgi:hypothetical protein
MAETGPPAPKSMAIPLTAFAVGAAVAVLVGVLSRVHDPTLDGTTTLGFRTVIQMKVVVSTLLAALVLVQGFTALVIYGKLPIKAPPWLGKAHRASGGAALVVALFVAYHCFWALGFEYGHLHSGEKVGLRTVIHGVVGCMVVGAAAVKIVAVRSRRAPGWFLPVAGGLLFTLFIAAMLTSTLWYYSEHGWPDADRF